MWPAARVGGAQESERATHGNTDDLERLDLLAIHAGLVVNAIP
jgi:hypothetical protein